MAFAGGATRLSQQSRRWRLAGSILNERRSCDQRVSWDTTQSRLGCAAQFAGDKLISCVADEWDAYGTAAASLALSRRVLVRRRSRETSFWKSCLKLSCARRSSNLVPCAGCLFFRAMPGRESWRKALIALWRYLETGLVPKGAALKV